MPKKISAFKKYVKARRKAKAVLKIAQEKRPLNKALGQFRAQKKFKSVPYLG